MTVCDLSPLASCYADLSGCLRKKRTYLHNICNEFLNRFEMLRLARVFLFPLALVPVYGLAADCEVEAKLRDFQIQLCDGERFLGAASESGTLVAPMPFAAIPVGLEKFWSDLCECYLLQVSGIAGAHTHVVKFYKKTSAGRLSLIPGGEFGSETGQISRVNQLVGFIVEVRDSDVARRRQTWEQYSFDGKKFSRLKIKKQLSSPSPSGRLRPLATVCDLSAGQTAMLNSMAEIGKKQT